MQCLTIDERFCGPPEMGNGGYVAGLLAATLSAQAAEITLRSSVPLMRALQVRADEAGRVILMDGATVVAEARAVPPPKDQPPATPTHQEAVRASRQYVGFRQHGFPRCFVCGPERPDGLRIFPGSLQGRSDVVAAPWVPDNSLAEGPCIRPEFIWAALDCTGAFACMGERLRPMLLGRITGQLTGKIGVGERCVVTGWCVSSEGRKHVAGTAVWNARGELRGVATSIWFDLPPRADAV